MTYDVQDTSIDTSRIVRLRSVDIRPMGDDTFMVCTDDMVSYRQSLLPLSDIDGRHSILDTALFPTDFSEEEQGPDVYVAYHAAFLRQRFPHFIAPETPFVCLHRVAYQLWPDLDSGSLRALGSALGLCSTETFNPAVAAKLASDIYIAMSEELDLDQMIAVSRYRCPPPSFDADFASDPLWWNCPAEAFPQKRKSWIFSVQNQLGE